MSRLRMVSLIAGAFLVAVAVLVGLGLALRDAVLLALAVSVQAAAGTYLWLLVVRRHETRDPVEALGAGLAVGTSLAVISGALLLPVTSWGWTIPALGAVLVWLARRVRRSAALVPQWSWRRSTLVGIGVALVGGLGSIALNLTRYPLGGDGPWTTYHRDMLYFEGLSTSVGVFGPHDSIFMAGADVRYHWLSYAWVGQLAHSVDAAPFATLTRLLPLVALIGCAALVVTWAARLLDRTSVTVLAGLLLVAGGYLGAANGTILNFDSPSQNLTTLWLLGALVAALAFLRGESGGWLLGLTGLLMAATVGGKVSSGVVAIVPLALVAVVASARRETWARRAWLVVGVGLLAVAVMYVVVISGSASGGDLNLFSLDSRASSIQALDSSKEVRGILLGTAGLLLAMAARWWGLVWLVGDRHWRWRADVVLGVGLVVAAVVPVIVLSQGVNETWFALAASAPLAVLSAVGLGVAWARVRSRGALVSSVVAGVVVTLVVPIFWIANPPYTTSVRFWGPWVGYALAVAAGLAIALVVRSRGFVLVAVAATTTILVVAGATARIAPVVAARYHPAVTADPAPASAPAQTAASTPVPTPGPAATAEPAPAESGASTVVEAADGPVAPVMTPPAELLEGSPPDRTTWTRADADAGAFLRARAGLDDIVVTDETTSFLVPALGQRRTYISGAPYQGLYGGKGTVGDIPGRIDTSLRFTRQLDPQAFADLCSAGVSWAWVSRAGTSLTDWAPYASVAFANDAVVILRLDRTACP